MCQRIFFSEQSPNSIFEVGIDLVFLCHDSAIQASLMALAAPSVAVIELNSLQFCKLFNQCLINDKVLIAVLSS